MTAHLYPWNTKEQLDELKQYLLQFTPTTSQLVGLFISDGLHKTTPISTIKIYCSHPDPLNTSDIVVWIFDTQKSIRLFVSTEVQLDKLSLTLEAQALARSKGDYTKALPRYFSDDEHEELYQKSCEALEQILKNYDAQRKSDLESTLYHGINLLWAPVLHQVYKVGFQAPCFKYIKSASTHSPKQIELKSHLKITQVLQEDIDLIKSATSVDYELEYLKQCAFISTAIKTNDKDEQLAGWVLTHRDMLVGALQVLPNWRRQGLADILVQNICTKYVEFFKENLTEVALDKLYFVATVEAHNDASARLFEKMGWVHFGCGVTWLYCLPKN